MQLPFGQLICKTVDPASCSMEAPAHLPTLHPVALIRIVEAGEVEEHGRGVGVGAAARQNHDTVLANALQRPYLQFHGTRDVA